MRSTQFTNDASSNYFFSWPPQAVVRRENFSGSTSHHFPSFWFLSIFHSLLFIFYFMLSVLFFSSRKNRQENEWGKSKGIHSGKMSMEMFTASALTSSKENTTCLPSETTEATAFILHYLWPALGHTIPTCLVHRSFAMLTVGWWGNCTFIFINLYISLCFQLSNGWRQT